jgi:hypothetical protein
VRLEVFVDAVNPKTASVQAIAQRLEQFADCGRFSVNVLKREAEPWKHALHPDFSCTIQNPRVSPEGRTCG